LDGIAGNFPSKKKHRPISSSNQTLVSGTN